MRQRGYRVATWSLALVGGLAVWTIATEVFPYHSLNHDEAVYLQQAAMLLEGQLHLYPPVDGAFRPWFFVEAGDRLYPKYAPVPAALFALGELVGGYRLALVGIATANLALVVGVVREVFDRPTGLLAGAFVLASPLFLLDSSVFLPYAPTTMLNLLFAYGYLRAGSTGDPKWAVLAGIGIGLAFFARPYTAVLFATPFIVHALLTLRRDWEAALGRQAIVAALGLAGVGLALGYNAVMTGSPWLFPYEAFAPHDGLGFGHRQIIGHEVEYTPGLALRANRVVVELFFTEWIAGGLLGAVVAGLGVVLAIREQWSPRVGVLAGLVISVVGGNVLFWGNLNILGEVGQAGDGLVAAFGPYYHFDLLLPTAAFGAVGVLWAGRTLHRQLAGRFERRQARATFGVLLLVSAGFAGTVTAGDLDERLEENMAVTDTYADAYEPFEDGAPRQSLVLLPDPYGDWLNHPFQPLRNEPGFDGRAVYALHDHPFELMEAFPDRRAYRYVYRGAWAPYAGSPTDARLQRLRTATADRVQLETTVGIPDGAIGVTARVATDDGATYYVARNVTERLELGLTMAEDGIGVTGDVRPVGNGTLAIGDREDVRLEVFVDYPAGGGFTYRFDIPVRVQNGTVSALTPRIEHCRDPRVCGGAAAHIPASAPDGVFVRTEMSTGEKDSAARSPEVAPGWT